MWKKEIHMQQQISDVLHMFYGEFLNLHSQMKVCVSVWVAPGGLWSSVYLLLCAAGIYISGCSATMVSHNWTCCAL